MESNSNSKKRMILICIIVVLLIIAGTAVGMFLNHKNQEDPGKLAESDALQNIVDNQTTNTTNQTVESDALQNATDNQTGDSTTTDNTTTTLPTTGTTTTGTTTTGAATGTTATGTTGGGTTQTSETTATQDVAWEPQQIAAMRFGATRSDNTGEVTITKELVGINDPENFVTPDDNFTVVITGKDVFNQPVYATDENGKVILDKEGNPMPITVTINPTNENPTKVVLPYGTYTIKEAGENDEGYNNKYCSFDSMEIKGYDITTNNANGQKTYGFALTNGNDRADVIVNNMLDEYTVTYLPGDQGTWDTAGEIHGGLNYGVTLPEFEGDTATDHNPGWTFNGWDKDLVDPVTGDETYTAQWTQDNYKVIYDPGTQGKWDAGDQTTEGLHYGDPTPTFTGDNTVTKEPGWKFAGWMPAVASTVTGDVTYVAQWTAEPLGDIIINKTLWKENKEDIQFTATLQDLYIHNNKSGQDQTRYIYADGTTGTVYKDNTIITVIVKVTDTGNPHPVSITIKLEPGVTVSGTISGTFVVQNGSVSVPNLIADGVGHIYSLDTSNTNSGSQFKIDFEKIYVNGSDVLSSKYTYTSMTVKDDVFAVLITGTSVYGTEVNEVRVITNGTAIFSDIPYGDNYTIQEIDADAYLNNNGEIKPIGDKYATVISTDLYKPVNTSNNLGYKPNPVLEDVAVNGNEQVYICNIEKAEDTTLTPGPASIAPTSAEFSNFMFATTYLVNADAALPVTEVPTVSEPTSTEITATESSEPTTEPDAVTNDGAAVTNETLTPATVQNVTNSDTKKDHSGKTNKSETTKNNSTSANETVVPAEESTGINDTTSGKGKTVESAAGQNTTDNDNSTTGDSVGTGENLVIIKDTEADASNDLE